MRIPLESRIDGLVRDYVLAVQRRYRLVIAVDLIATLIAGLFAATHLGVNMDNKTLLSPDLPFQKAARAYQRYFHSLDDALLIVVDAETAEQARGAAALLAAKIAEAADTFSDVYVPGADEFFQRHGLLYRSLDELDQFVDQISVAQPVLADLAREPSVARLARIIRFGLDRERDHPGTTPEAWPRILDQIGDATVRVFEEYPVALSWESLIVAGTALDPETRQVIVAEPVLDFNKLLAASQAIDTIRAAARELDLAPERGVRVRITGNPALNYEEMLGLVWDVGGSSAVSFLLVTGVLYLALRNMRLVAAAATTLLIGLVWTAAFAAAAVGQLNVVSIAFGVLFIGLGVDFAIHLGMHYADAAHTGGDSHKAMQVALDRIGTALILCSLTTAVGFFAFYPTGYRGVAELGLIAGGGMVIIVAQTLTLFPTMVSALMERRTRPVRGSLQFRLSPPGIVTTHPGTIAIVALALGGAAAAALPHLRFDHNVVAMRNPSTESVQAFDDLLARSRTSPWYIDALAPNLEAAQRLAARMRELEVVRTAVSLADYVPEDQEEKREVLSTVAMLLDVPGGDGGGADLPDTQEQIRALRELHTSLDAEWLRRDRSALGRSARQLAQRIEQFLQRIDTGNEADAALADLQEVLLGNFSEQLERLRRAVDPPLIRLDDLPRSLKERMVAADGHARVQIFPAGDLGGEGESARFVDAVREIEPQATGVAVNLLEFGRATSQSLREALSLAFGAITLLLLLLWRRFGDTALVLAPLVLGAMLTGGLMVAIGMQFNFANVVVLPLLIGIGVDSGIHLVHSARIGEARDALLESVTARAVFFSAVTTITSFGSLAFSSHRGIASMGVLLVCGMLIILACNLIVLPALVTLRDRWANSPLQQ